MAINVIVVLAWKSTQQGIFMIAMLSVPSVEGSCMEILTSIIVQEANQNTILINDTLICAANVVMNDNISVSKKIHHQTKG